MLPFATPSRFLLRPSDLCIDPALRKLMRLRNRAWLRHTFRNLKTVRGALLFTIGAFVLVLWIGPSVAMAFFGASVRGHFDPEVIRTVVPLALLAFCAMSVLTSAHQKGIQFTAAEIDFLFAGPFNRRELLVYKVYSTLAGVVVVSLLFSVFFLQYASLWLAAFVGSCLTLAFVQLFSTAVVLFGHTLAEQAYTRTRKIVLLALAALAGIGLAEAAMAASEHGLLPLVTAFRHSWAGIVLLAPMDVFARAFLARTLFPELVGWGALALGVDLALLAVVLRLDVNYMEASIVVSQKLYRRREQIRRGGGLAWTVGSTGRVRVPLFPWLGGAGPVVRRQLIHAVRTSRGLVFFFLVAGIPMGIMAMTARGEHNVAMGVLPGLLMFVTFFFTQMVPFDFRGDLDHMESLKALPLRPAAIAAGQLVVPTLVLTAVHLAVLGMAAAMIRGMPAVLWAVALFSPPFNFLLVGLENLLFLLFPARMLATMPGDVQHIGRTIVQFMGKMLVLGVVCGVAALLGGIAYLIGGGSWGAALSVAWIVLVMAGVALVPCVAAAYRKFDVSVDTPP
jgi:hypothetical protein